MPETSRRGVLAALPAGAALSVLPWTTGAAGSLADRSQWNAAMRQLRRVEAEDAAFMPGWLATSQRCATECEAIPHVSLGSDPYTGLGTPVDTADRLRVSYARKMVEQLATGKRRHDDLPDLKAHEHLMRDLAHAADVRDAKVQAIRDRDGMDAFDEKAEQLGDALAEARSRLMQTPAPDLEALRWKLNHLTEEAQAAGGSMACYRHGYVAQALQDIARLMPDAA